MHQQKPFAQRQRRPLPKKGPLYLFPLQFCLEEENSGLSGITDSRCVEFGS